MDPAGPSGDGPRRLVNNIDRCRYFNEQMFAGGSWAGGRLVAGARSGGVGDARPKKIAILSECPDIC
jgi:hypothetical protein